MKVHVLIINQWIAVLKYQKYRRTGANLNWLKGLQKQKTQLNLTHYRLIQYLMNWLQKVDQNLKYIHRTLLNLTHLLVIPKMMFHQNPQDMYQNFNLLRIYIEKLLWCVVCVFFCLFIAESNTLVKVYLWC